MRCGRCCQCVELVLFVVDSCQCVELVLCVRCSRCCQCVELVQYISQNLLLQFSIVAFLICSYFCYLPFYISVQSISYVFCLLICFSTHRQVDELRGQLDVQQSENSSEKTLTARRKQEEKHREELKKMEKERKEAQEVCYIFRIVIINLGIN